MLSQVLVRKISLKPMGAERIERGVGLRDAYVQQQLFLLFWQASYGGYSVATSTM